MLQNKIKTLIATFAGIAMVLSLVAVSAVSSAEAAYTRSLTVGSSGADVSELQATLVAGGYLVIPTGVLPGYFGTLTQAAVARWQAAVGVSPAAGYFGPISQAKLAGAGSGSNSGSFPAGCTSAAGYSSTTGTKCDTGGSTVPGCSFGALFSSTTGASCTGGSTPSDNSLSGTEGSIDDVTSLGSYNNEDVSEGQNDVKVLGADVDVSVDGDIALKSVKVRFDSTGNTGSDNLDDYLDSVSIWLGSEEIGRADVADFSESTSGIFTKTINVSGATIDADSTAKLYVAVDSINNIDSGDISGDSWTVDIDAIRFEDGSGVVTTDTAAGVGNLGADVSINFVSYATAVDTELKISTASNTPVAGIVIADATVNTDKVSLLKGKLKLNGSSSAILDQFPVTFTVAGGALDLASTTGNVTLKIGGEEFSESVSASSPNALVASVTFDNLDFAIDAGATVDFEVLADINDVDGTILAAGATLKAEVTASNRNVMDVENDQGDQLSDSSEKSGTATGNAQEIRVSGIMLTLVSTGTSVAAGTGASDDQGTFTIKYKITAIGDAVYVSSLADAQLSGNTTGKTTVLVDRAGTATVGGTSVTLANVTDSTLNSVGNYMIEDGSSETFELTTTVQLPTAGAAGQFRAALGGVRWSTTDIALPASSYTSNLSSFKTSYIGLN